LLRDSTFYLLSVLAMIIVIYDEKVYLYEAVGFLVLYAGYIVMLLFNNRIESYCKKHITFMGDVTGSTLKTPNNYTNLEGETIVMSGENSRNLSRNSSIVDESQINSNSDDATSKYFNPFVLPINSPLQDQIKFYICWPLSFVLYISIPDIRVEKWNKYYIVSFVCSLVWLSIFSYIMVWMITIIGYTFAIPDTIMGLTLIAFGASVNKIKFKFK
jgi:Ca2+/Na+ antiporter